MKRTLVDILACPVCRAKLLRLPKQKAYICQADRLAYPIKASIPIMMVDEARELSLAEHEQLLLTL
jgi:uncharacterized protein